MTRQVTITVTVEDDELLTVAALRGKQPSDFTDEEIQELVLHWFNVRGKSTAALRKIKAACDAFFPY